MGCASPIPVSAYAYVGHRVAAAGDHLHLRVLVAFCVQALAPSIEAHTASTRSYVRLIGRYYLVVYVVGAPVVNGDMLFFFCFPMEQASGLPG